MKEIIEFPPVCRGTDDKSEEVRRSRGPQKIDAKPQIPGRQGKHESETRWSVGCEKSIDERRLATCEKLERTLFKNAERHLGSSRWRSTD
jgi:hypothetical protein